MPIVEVTDLSNQEFLARYAAPGRVGLAGGSALIERTIRKATQDIAATPVPHTAYVQRRDTKGSR
jgi:hypothetical protein